MLFTLAASPQAYVEIDLEDRRVDKIDDQVIDETLKHLRIYRKEIGNFLSDMRGLTIDDVIDELPEEFEEFDSSRGLLKETELLSQILPIEPDQILTDELRDDFEDDEIFDNDDEFDEKEEFLTDSKELIDEKSTDEEHDIPENMEGENEPVKDFGGPKGENMTDELPDEAITVENEEENLSQEDPFEAKEKGEENVEEESEEGVGSEKGEENEEEIMSEPSATSEIVKEETPQSDEEESEEEIVEDNEEEVKTINEQFDVPQKTVVQHHEETKANSMMELISVNHQFMFVKELFKDDQVSFQNALYELEEYDTFDDAVEFLVQGYAKEFSWDMQSNEVKELLKVLFRKFRD